MIGCNQKRQFLGASVRPTFAELNKACMRECAIEEFAQTPIQREHAECARMPKHDTNHYANFIREQ